MNFYLKKKKSEIVNENIISPLFVQVPNASFDDYESTSLVSK